MVIFSFIDTATVSTYTYTFKIIAFFYLYLILAMDLYDKEIDLEVSDVLEFGIKIVHFFIK